MLAARIEDALNRNLPLDGLSGDKAQLPPHMQCVLDSHHPPAMSKLSGILVHPCSHSTCEKNEFSHARGANAWRSMQNLRQCLLFACRPKPETLKRRQDERKAEAAGRRGTRGAARIGKVSSHAVQHSRIGNRAWNAFAWNAFASCQMGVCQ